MDEREVFKMGLMVLIIQRQNTKISLSKSHARHNTNPKLRFNLSFDCHDVNFRKSSKYKSLTDRDTVKQF